MVGLATGTVSKLLKHALISVFQHKQKLRMEKQQGYASQIVQLSSELDFAKERYKNMQVAEAEERQKILSNRLKPKGQKLKK